MKKILFLGVLLLAMPKLASAQFGGGGFAGGAGGFGGNAGSYGESSASDTSRYTPAQVERSKRGLGAPEVGSIFIDGSVLMNVKADEYVAVFAVLEEGKTPEEANTKMDATIAKFKEGIKALGIRDEETFVDFVTQNRIYAYNMIPATPPSTTPAANPFGGLGQAAPPAQPAQGPVPHFFDDTTASRINIAREELVGFELKKNVSIHFKDKLLLDQLALAASHAQIFDLVKVDYVVNDREAIQARLEAQTMALVKHKVEQYQTGLGIKLPPSVQIVADLPSVYYPVEQYSSYRASEEETVNVPSNSDYAVLHARKSKTTFFNAISGNGFDVVINPTIIEPVVQFTTYIKLKYYDPKQTPKQR